VTSSSIRCVVFDLDDTLYLERGYVKSGFNAAGRYLEDRCGLQGFASVAWREFEMGSRGDIFNRAFSMLGCEVEDSLIRDLVEVYRTHKPLISLEDDARDCLEGMVGAIALALISDGPMASQRAKVDALEIDRWIPITILTADLGPGMGKPHPRAFEMVEKQTGCSGRNCVYVADNPAKDFQGPRKLGWRTVRCRRPQGLHAEVVDDGPMDWSVPNLSGLPKILVRSD